MDSIDGNFRGQSPSHKPRYGFPNHIPAIIFLFAFLPLTPDLYSCQSMSIERGGAEEAPSTKHRAPTRTIADSEETCINLATLSSRPERSAPSPCSPAASNAEDPEREIPGPPARPAHIPAH